MKIFSWFKNLFSKKTKWNNSPNEFIHKFSNGKYVLLNSNILVDEGQNAVVIARRKVCDIFLKGDFQLTPATMPLCAKRCRLNKAKTNRRTKKLEFPTKFDGCILFVNLYQCSLNFVSRNNKIKNNEIKGFKYRLDYTLSIQVVNVQTFAKYIVSKNIVLKDKNLKSHLKHLLNVHFYRLLKNYHLSIYDVISNHTKLENILRENLIDLSKLGLNASDLMINNVILSKRLQKRISLNLPYIDTAKLTEPEQNLVPNDEEIDNIYYLPNASDIRYADLYSNSVNAQPANEKNEIENEQTNNIFFCFRCGEKLLNAAIFCHKCGARQENIKGDNNDRD